MMSCSSSEPSSYCSTTAATELKLYQAFIFSVPVFFTFLFLLLFYVFFLRRRRANWQSMRMRSRGENPRLSELGIKKEVREMLPVVVFKESFLIRETQCSVCLGDYKSDERLQRIPPCGHTFHVDCIDHWLATHTTCPLCRVSLLQATKSSTDPPNNISEESSSETQLQEQRSESQTDVNNGVQEMEANCSCQVLGQRTKEESRHHGEGSDVVINIESDVNPEENARM